MLRLLADENFNGDIVRGLLLRQPDFELVRVQDVGLGGAEDPDILAWAAENDRIVLTHDYATMADFAYERVAAACWMHNKVLGVGGIRHNPVLQGELIRLGARFVIAGTDTNYVLAGARQDTTALRAIKID